MKNLFSVVDIAGCAVEKFESKMDAKALRDKLNGGPFVVEKNKLGRVVGVQPPESDAGYRVVKAEDHWLFDGKV